MVCCPAALLSSCHQSPPVLLQLLFQSCLLFGLFFFFPEKILKETLCAERVEVSYVVWGAGTRVLRLEAVGDRS